MDIKRLAFGADEAPAGVSAMELIILLPIPLVDLDTLILVFILVQLSTVEVPRSGTITEQLQLEP